MSVGSEGHREQHVYRPDIDGLRAVAVLSVVLFHAFPTLLGAGFLGVDVFFVISGFLITGIVQREVVAGTFTLPKFYARRILRIIPALALVMIAAFVIGWLVMLPTEFRQLGWHIVGGSLFFSNFQFWSETGYFDKASELKPLLHLWSLSVEEQFYIVWPLIVMALARRRAILLTSVLVLAAMSFATQAVLSGDHQSAAFYLPVSRAWELMFGAALAVAQHGTVTGSARARVPTWISPTLGLALIAASFTLDGGASSAWWRLLPTVGAVLVLGADGRNWCSRYILGNRVMVGVGRISYPLYLWHWPLLSFYRLTHADAAPVSSIAALVAVSFVLAWLTYILLERPVRFGLLRARAVPALSATLAALCLVGLSDQFAQGFPARLPPAIRKYTTVAYDFAGDARVMKCWLPGSLPGDGFAPECYTPLDQGKKSIVVWGDSHAGRLYPGFAKAFGDRFNILQFARDACPPALDDEYPNCQSGNEFALAQIKAVKPSLVVLFGAWDQHANDFKGSLIERGLTEVLEKIHEAGVRSVWVVGPAPHWKPELPRVLADYWRSHRTESEIPERLSGGLDPHPFQIDAEMRNDILPDQAEYISLVALLCNKDGCLDRVSDEPEGLITADYGHFTTEGATYVARHLEPRLNRSLGIAAR